MKFFYIAVLGLVGVFARYATNMAFARNVYIPFPLATLIINVAGSFLIGVVFVLGIQQQVIHQDLRLGLMVGLLGGFTTFSTYSLETLTLLQSGNIRLGLLYFLVSPAAGLVAAWAGCQLTQRFY